MSYSCESAESLSASVNEIRRLFVDMWAMARIWVWRSGRARVHARDCSLTLVANTRTQSILEKTVKRIVGKSPGEKKSSAQIFTSFSFSCEHKIREWNPRVGYLINRACFKIHLVTRKAATSVHCYVLTRDIGKDYTCTVAVDKNMELLEWNGMEWNASTVA